MRKIILLSILVLSGCLEKETTFKGCPEGLVYENNICAKPTNPPVNAVYRDLGLKGSEGGSVVITFANNSSLTCVENCAAISTPVLQGTTGSAQATAKAGYVFSGWEDFSGATSNICSVNPCSLSINASFNLKPKFISAESPLNGQVLMFVASAGPNYSDGNALWRTDGTASGTVLVKDPNPTVSNYYEPGFYAYVPMSVIDNVLYLIGGNQPSSYNTNVYNDHGQNLELWTSNGLTSGTALFADLNTEVDAGVNQSSFALGYIKKDNKLVMSAQTSFQGGVEYLYLDADKTPHPVDLIAGDYQSTEPNPYYSGGSLRDGNFTDRVLLPNGNLIFKAYQWSIEPYNNSGYKYLTNNFSKIFVTLAGENIPQRKFTNIDGLINCSAYDQDEFQCNLKSPVCTFARDSVIECTNFNEETQTCDFSESVQITSCSGPSQDITEQFNVSQIMYSEGAPMALYVKELDYQNSSFNRYPNYALYATDGVTNIQLDYTQSNPSDMAFVSPYTSEVIYFKGQYYFIKQTYERNSDDPNNSTYINNLVRTQLPEPGLQVVLNNVGSVNKINEDKLVYVLAEGGEEPVNDGTYVYNGESSRLVQLGLYLGNPLINVSGKVYFRGYANDTGNLSYMDADTNQITMVKDNLIISGFMGIVNGNIVFSAWQPGNSFGTEPWVSNGTESGTFMLKDIKPGSGDGLLNSPKGYLLQPNNN